MHLSDLEEQSYFFTEKVFLSCSRYLYKFCGAVEVEGVESTYGCFAGRRSP